MIGTIVSTVKSFYSASHYEWAAYERKGIGLTYLFGLTATFCTVIAIITVIASLYFGGNYSDTFMSKLTDGNPYLLFLAVLGDGVIYYACLIMLISFVMMMSLINFAIIVAMFGIILDFCLRAQLSYDQILRVTVYAIVPPFVITIILTLALNITNEIAINVIYFTGLIFYEFFAVMCAKNYLNA